jgi:hypothetical protein
LHEERKYIKVALLLVILFLKHEEDILLGSGSSIFMYMHYAYMTNYYCPPGVRVGLYHKDQGSSWSLAFEL